jgi:putative hydrolase of HD superfamily
MSTEKYPKAVVELGKLALVFSRVNRVTYHDDSLTRESDSDHTVMLALIACSYAERCYKDTIDLGKVAQFAIIHDLVEAYAGDTDSLGITQESKMDKNHREEQAFIRIKEEFQSSFPWLINTIEEYDSLASKEARYIKLLDKAMPKITNILNNGKRLIEAGKSKDHVEELFDQQIIMYTETYGAEFPEVIELLKDLMKGVMTKTYA